MCLFCCLLLVVKSLAELTRIIIVRANVRIFVRDGLGCWPVRWQVDGTKSLHSVQKFFLSMREDAGNRGFRDGKRAKQRERKGTKRISAHSTPTGGRDKAVQGGSRVRQKALEGYSTPRRSASLAIERRFSWHKLSLFGRILLR